jgi:hypothetical protein
MIAAENCGKVAERGKPRSISDAQQVFPFAKVAPEAHAFRDLECRDHTPFDLLAGLSGSFASSPMLVSSFSRVFLASCICSIRAARFHNHVIFTMLLGLIEHVRRSYIRSLKIGVIVLCKSVTDTILTSEAALKQRRRNKMLRASEFPGCPDFPE